MNTIRILVIIQTKAIYWSGVSARHLITCNSKETKSIRNGITPHVYTEKITSSYIKRMVSHITSETNKLCNLFQRITALPLVEHCKMDVSEKARKKKKSSKKDLSLENSNKHESKLQNEIAYTEGVEKARKKKKSSKKDLQSKRSSKDEKNKRREIANTENDRIDRKEDILSKQARELSEYRKRQKERWRKANGKTNNATSSSSSRKHECDIKELVDNSKSKRNDQNMVSSREAKEDFIRSNNRRHPEEDRCRKLSVSSEQTKHCNHKEGSEEKVTNPESVRSEKSENSERIRGKNLSIPSEQTIKHRDHTDGTEDKVDNSEKLSPSNSIHSRKHKRKRRKKFSESEVSECKRVSIEEVPRPHVSYSPVIIDLGSDSDDEPRTAPNGDKLEIQDMDLATSSDDDIVILVTSPAKPGTSSLKQTAYRKDSGGMEDDITYMGTVINLDDSPTDAGPPKGSIPLSHRDSPGLPALRPPSFNTPENTTPSHHVAMSQHMPYPSVSPVFMHSRSSTMSYSTASHNFQTVSSSFSSFMAAAALGNAVVTPSGDGLFPIPRQTDQHITSAGDGQAPTSSQNITGSGFPRHTRFLDNDNTTPGPPWIDQHVPFFQPTAQFHHSAVSQAQQRGPSHAAGRRSSREKTPSPKPKKTKLRNRSWLLVDEELPESDGLMNFTAVSYNILAQNLLDNNMYLYPDSDTRYLEWEYRSENLLAEIEHYSPDILCLQEVKEDHYKELLKPRLEELGYECCYKKRTRNMQDGCATVFKTGKFKLDVVKPLEYLNPGGNCVLDRDNVALIVRLIPRNQTTDSKVIVANTHLLFNPKRGDVKLAQLVLLLAEVDRLAYQSETETPFSPKYHPTLIMGDLNSEPWSPLYQFLSTGTVEYAGTPINLFSGQAEGRVSYTGRMFGKDVIPKRLKITDFCQHMDDVRARFAPWESERQSPTASDQETQRRSTSPDSSSENRACVVNRDFLQQQSGKLRTMLPLSSVYKHKTFSLRNRRLENEVTTYHGQAHCTVDYIFYACGARNIDLSENQKLRLVRRLELLTDKEMKELGPLPNRELSSDHLLLGAAFQLKL